MKGGLNLDLFEIITAKYKYLDFLIYEYYNIMTDCSELDRIKNILYHK